jgi:protein involved in polysaccharide export with SLBB domain
LAQRGVVDSLGTVLSAASILSYLIKGIRSMLRQLLARLVVVSITVFLVVFAFNLGAAGRQEAVKPPPPPSLPSDVPPTGDSWRRMIDNMIARYDLKPHAAPAIPDDPPPHEGTMITPLPCTVEPPDLILVEVLEALPGRPISGERLLRPDGKISLGFYGDVYVRGLTIDQVKVAIIKHLRNYLNDEALGLEIPPAEREEEAVPPAAERMPFPEPPKVPADLAPDAKKSVKQKQSSRPSSYRPSPNPHSPNARRAYSASNRRSVPIRTVGFPETSQESRQKERPEVVKPERAFPFAPGGAGAWTVVSPEGSLTVFVDVTAYNSKNYYVLGDVVVTGRLPYTGNETVLDALNYAGGLSATAEPKDIQLVRPGLNGKPSKVYKIDRDGIQKRGEVATNYQIFPGDRLAVGRNEVVKTTTEIDRLNAPIMSLTGSVLQEAFMLRSLQSATAADRNELLKEYVDFWAKELARPGGVKFDEQTLREALIRKMNLPPNPSAPPPSSR